MVADIRCFEQPRTNFLTRRANQLHYSMIAQLVTPTALPDDGLFGAMAGEKLPNPQLKLHPACEVAPGLRAASDRPRVAEPRALPMRVPKEIST
jgi:hypothetical protein